MADLPGYLRACLHTGKLASLAILVSGGIVLQILVSDAFKFWSYFELLIQTDEKKLLCQSLITILLITCAATGMCFVQQLVAHAKW